MRILRLLFISILLISSIGYSNENPLYCTPELRPVLEKIQAFPEGQEVISRVLEEGPIQIKLNRDLPEKFEGYWSAYDRTIYLNKNQWMSDCSLITTLLFELHNALRTADIEYMYSLASNHAIERDEFIEAFEYIEYENALATSLLVEQGAECGIFPYDCSWDLASNFAEHLDVQRDGGHSAWIGHIYDELF